MSRLGELADEHPWRWGAFWGVIIGTGAFVTDTLLGEDIGAAMMWGIGIGVVFGVVIGLVRLRQARI